MQILRQTCDDRAQQDVEHGDAIVVLHEATTAHNAYHGGNGPAILLVRSKQRGHNGCRGHAFVLDAVVGDVTILPRFLEIERELPAFVSPGETCGVGEDGVNVERSASGHHTVEGDVIVGVGHQSASMGGG